MHGDARQMLRDKEQVSIVCKDIDDKQRERAWHSQISSANMPGVDEEELATINKGEEEGSTTAPISRHRALSATAKMSIEG